MERNVIVIIDPRQDVSDLLDGLIRQNEVMHIKVFVKKIKQKCTTFPTIARATRAKNGEFLHIEGIAINKLYPIEGITRSKFYPKKDKKLSVTFRIFKLEGNKIIFGKPKKR